MPGQLPRGYPVTTPRRSQGSADGPPYLATAPRQPHPQPQVNALHNEIVTAMLTFASKEDGSRKTAFFTDCNRRLPIWQLSVAEVVRLRPYSRPEVSPATTCFYSEQSIAKWNESIQWREARDERSGNS